MLEGRTVPGYDEGWRQVEAAFVRARDLVRKREGRLILFPIPFQQDVLGNYPNEQYRLTCAVDY